MLHDIAAACIEFGFEPWDYLGRTLSADGYEFTLGDVEEDHLDPVTPIVGALEWIREQPGELFVETLVSLDPYMPGQFGTLDLAIYTPELLTIFDWKFGYVLVGVISNEQLQAYAIGLIKLLRELGYKIPKKIRLIIEQPRPTGGARFYTPWEITLDELMGFTEVMEQIWAAANDPEAQRVAGEKQCYYCAAKDEPGGCYAYNRFQLDLIGQKFPDLDDEDGELELPDSELITPKRRTFIVRHKQMITSWLKELEASAMGDALSGRPVPGLKAIDGPDGDRAWSDVEVAEAILVETLAADAFTKKLKSPPQAAKLLEPKGKKKGHPEAWEKLQKLIIRPPGKPQLVPIEDPRPAKTVAVDKFSNLDAEPSEQP